MKDHVKYLGLNLQDALVLALKTGEQLRVMNSNGVHMHYADEPEAAHVLVWTKGDKVVRTQ